MALKWIAAAGLLLGACAAAHAKTFTVTRTADTADGRCDSHCSLREAILAANARSGPDKIVLRHSSYLLTISNAELGDEENAATGDLDISDDVEIRGRSGGSRIDGNALDRIFDVQSEANVELHDLLIVNGLAPEGGGIYNTGELTLKRVRVLDNDARGPDFAHGGGLFNAGELELDLSEVAQNSTSIASFAPTDFGKGGGIYNTGRMRLTDTTVRDNFCSTAIDFERGFGGGLFNLGQALIERSLFTHNSADEGEGHAIANFDGAALELVNSTLSGNSSTDGSSAALANGLEDGSFAGGTATLTNVTLADNGGGGLVNTGLATLLNTIVAGNFGISSSDINFYSDSNCENFGTLNHIAFLVGNAGNCEGDIVVDNATVLDNLLFPLADNNGPTLTHALRAGPPTAIDTGDNSVCSGEDQRDKDRPLDGDGDGVAICDIGAFEKSRDD